MSTKAYLLLFIPFLFIACSSSERDAGLMKSFGYLGTKDTSVAILEGRITTGNVNHDIALSNAVISTQNFNAVSDTSGKFRLCLPKGNYTIKVQKDGFKDVLLNNFNAEPGQFSDAEIILNKGGEVVEYDITRSKIGN